MLDVPNFFWESEPTLYPLYIAVREYLEIKPRIQVLNERCRVFLDLAEILSDSIADNRTSCTPHSNLYSPIDANKTNKCSQIKHGSSLFSSSSLSSLLSPKSFSVSASFTRAKARLPLVSSPAQWAALSHPHPQAGPTLPIPRQAVSALLLHQAVGLKWASVA